MSWRKRFIFVLLCLFLTQPLFAGGYEKTAQECAVQTDIDRELILLKRKKQLQKPIWIGLGGYSAFWILGVVTRKSFFLTPMLFFTGWTLFYSVKTDKELEDIQSEIDNINWIENNM